MKKTYKKIKEQSIKDLEKEIENMRREIAKEKLSVKVNPPKDTNSLMKKKKTLAVYLTVLSQKKELESVKKGA